LDRLQLWEAVKDVRKSEGKAIPSSGSPITQKEAWAQRQQLAIESHESKLSDINIQRSVLEKWLALLGGRNKLLENAIKRAATVNENLPQEVDEDEEEAQAARGECGWDVRLMWGDKEWEYGVAEGTVRDGYGDEGTNWWCPEGASCVRHAGWQKLQRQVMDKERIVLMEALDVLSTRERDIRLLKAAVLNPDSVKPQKDDAPVDSGDARLATEDGADAKGRGKATKMPKAQTNGAGEGKAKQKKKAL